MAGKPQQPLRGDDLEGGVNVYAGLVALGSFCLGISLMLGAKVIGAAACEIASIVFSM